MADLPPCPFCGSKKVYAETNAIASLRAVHCCDCAATAPLDRWDRLDANNTDERDLNWMRGMILASITSLFIGTFIGSYISGSVTDTAPIISQAVASE